MPFLLYNLVSEDLIQAWGLLGQLGALIWTTDITDLELYVVRKPIYTVSAIRLCHSNTYAQEELHKVIQQVMDVSASISPSTVVKKNKFHIFTHLPEHIALHGTAILYATERYESFNHVFRLSSLHSNRLSPSRDIAKQFAQASCVLHVLQGGEWYDNERGCHVRAGINVRKYMLEHASSSHLLAFSQPTLDLLRNGATPGATQQMKQSENDVKPGSTVTICWSETMAASCSEDPSVQRSGLSTNDSVWTLCRSVNARIGGDTVRIDDCVMYDFIEVSPSIPSPQPTVNLMAP